MYILQDQSNFHLILALLNGLLCRMKRIAATKAENITDIMVRVENWLMNKKWKAFCPRRENFKYY